MEKTPEQKLQWDAEFKVGISRAVGFYRRKLFNRQELSEIEQDALIHLLDALEDMTQAAEVDALWRGLRV